MVNVTHRDRVERRAAQRNALGSIYRSSVYRRKLCNAGQTDANRRRPSCSINTSVVGRIGRVGPSGVSRRDGGSQIACRLQRGPDGNGSRYSGCGERRRGCLWMIYSINLLQLLSLIRGSFSFFFFFTPKRTSNFFCLTGCICQRIAECEPICFCRPLKSHWLRTIFSKQTVFECRFFFQFFTSL